MTSPEITADFLKEYLNEQASGSLEKLFQSDFEEEKQAQLAVAPSYRSPITGTVTAVNLQSNSLYNSPKAAIVVEDLSELCAELYIPQASVQKIQAGDKVLLQGAGIFGEISGEVLSINPSAVQSLQNGAVQVLIPVRVRLTSDSKGARPGYIVTAKILSGPQQMAYSFHIKPFVRMRKIRSMYGLCPHQGRLSGAQSLLAKKQPK